MAERDESGEAPRELTVREAGRLGGAARKAVLGPEGYAAMGRKGGSTTKARYGQEHYEEIGHRAGVKVLKDRGPEHFQEIGKKGGEACRKRWAAIRAAKEQAEAEAGG